jgi:RNA polymerase sigma factor (sigma-70 family)
MAKEEELGLAAVQDRWSPAACASKRQARLEDMVVRYRRLVRSVVVRVSGRRDEDLGAEIEQRVAEALWCQVRQANAIDYPTSYVYRCAVRETVREIQREQTRGSATFDDETVPAALHHNPESAALAQELADAAHRCLDDLSHERANAALAHIAGLEVEEIMSLHAWPYQKARNLVARGMADLRKRLREQGFDAR